MKSRSDLGRPAGARSRRFDLLRRFDNRCAIIDRKRDNEIIVFCASEEEALPILAALNDEVKWRRAKKPTPARSAPGELISTIPGKIVPGKGSSPPTADVDQIRNRKS